MAEYLLIILVVFIIVYALVKGCTVNININYKQEFSAEDRKLLEDLYNGEGELKDKAEDDAISSLDAVIQSLQELMLESEEESNG